MASYRKVALLSLPDAAYIAGLIDGEGTITLSRRHANENRQLVVSISNNEKPLLDYVLTTIGAGKISNKRKTQAHHADSFTGQSVISRRLTCWNRLRAVSKPTNLSGLA